jgi:hypothetical protein
MGMLLLQSVMVVCVISCLIMMMILISFSPEFSTAPQHCVTVGTTTARPIENAAPYQNDAPVSSSVLRNLYNNNNNEKNPPLMILPQQQQQGPQQQQHQALLPQWMNASRPVYLHIHMAKTAGTEHNGIFANRFERVCGHKGYSYDAYQTNERFRKSGATNVNFHSIRDIYSVHIDPAYSRHRVPPQTMDEIGYEDCDYISNELPWTFWHEKIPLRRYAAHNISVEFHIPCRDPLDHLMSQCNYMGVTFQCQTNSPVELAKEVDKCVIEMNRFSLKLLDHFDRLEQSMGLQSSFACFNAIPLEPYIDYMADHRLQPKRFASEYTHRPSNQKRHRNDECIWQQSATEQEKLRQYLISRFDYYRFCDQCLGSTNDLLFRSASSSSAKATTSTTTSTIQR